MLTPPVPAHFVLTRCTQPKAVQLSCCQPGPRAPPAPRRLGTARSPGARPILPPAAPICALGPHRTGGPAAPVRCRPRSSGLGPPGSATPAWPNQSSGREDSLNPGPAGSQGRRRGGAHARARAQAEMRMLSSFPEVRVPRLSFLARRCAEILRPRSLRGVREHRARNYPPSRPRRPPILLLLSCLSSLPLGLEQWLQA